MTEYQIKLPDRLTPVETKIRIEAVQEYLETQVPVPEGESVWPTAYNPSRDEEGNYQMRFPIVTGPVPQKTKERVSLLWKKDVLTVKSIGMELTRDMKDNIEKILLSSD